jgi:hypothetical protein
MSREKTPENKYNNVENLKDYEKGTITGPYYLSVCLNKFIAINNIENKE